MIGIVASPALFNTLLSASISVVSTLFVLFSQRLSVSSTLASQSYFGGDK